MFIKIDNYEELININLVEHISRSGEQTFFYFHSGRKLIIDMSDSFYNSLVKILIPDKDIKFHLKPKKITTDLSDREVKLI